MRYFDVHTHQLPIHAEDYAIVNTIVGREGEIVVPSSFGRSYGIHPWYIGDTKKQVRQLKDLVIRTECVAIGEAGFDKCVATPMEQQQQVFIAQVRLSEELQKPLLIHCVKAWAELIACRKQLKPQMPWIIHGFRGNGELASQLIRLGLYLSFGVRFNPCALRVAWPDRIFLETDDESIDIRLVYHKVSEVLGIPEADLAGQINKNISILHLGS